MSYRVESRGEAAGVVGVEHNATELCIHIVLGRDLAEHVGVGGG